MHLVSHLGSAIVVASILAPIVEKELKIGHQKTIVLICFGAFSPDIDAVSVLFDHAIFYSNKWYSHHGALHSIVGIALVALVCSIFLPVFEKSPKPPYQFKSMIVCFCMICLGGLLHLVEDLPSPKGPWGGLMLFWPFSLERYGGWRHFWWQNEFLEFLFLGAAFYSLLLLVIYERYIRYRKIAYYVLFIGNTISVYFAVKFVIVSRYSEEAQWAIYQKELLGSRIYNAMHAINSTYSQIWTTTLF